MTRILSRSVLALSVIALGLVLAAPSDARAEGFISGLVGYNFGGNSGCPSVTDCQDKHTNWGGSIGTVGVIGFEEELAYAKDFFGTTAGASNSVLTLMSNLLIAPGIGPVHPYVTGGVGLMRSQAEFTPSQLLSVTDNQFAWDVGAGVMVFFGPVGVRGDIRHFHSFQNSSLPFLGPIGSGGGPKVDYGRAAASIVLKF